MRTCPLGPQHDKQPNPPAPRTARGVLICEISERLLEWAEMESRQKVYCWLTRLATLAGDREATDAIWLYLRLSTGDLGQLTASFSELGAARHRTKQAQAQETDRALRVIARHFPELADEINALTHAFVSKQDETT